MLTLYIVYVIIRKTDKQLYKVRVRQMQVKDNGDCWSTNAAYDGKILSVYISEKIQASCKHIGGKVLETLCI